MEKYPHIATERFDRANIWITYILSQLKKYLKGSILEVGAGCGSFSRGYIKKNKKIITLTDHDPRNIKDLKRKFNAHRNVKVTSQDLKKIRKKYDTIIYFNVLEHIKEDDKEIKLALSKLNKGGFLIILVLGLLRVVPRPNPLRRHLRRRTRRTNRSLFRSLVSRKVSRITS